jgi:heme/copper-type cytochrome/quinol oxidase subunit 2
MKSQIIVYATTLARIELITKSMFYLLTTSILISLVIFIGLLKKKKNKKVEATLNIIFTLVSVLITIFLFYVSFKSYL